MTSTTDPANWPEAHCRTPAHMTDALLRRLDELTTWPPPPRVLELGVGTGAIADRFAAHYGTRVVGVDVRPAPKDAQWQHMQLDVCYDDKPLMHLSPDIVVANPPFVLSGWKRGPYDPATDGVMQFANVALSLVANHGFVCILHRTTWWTEMQTERQAWRRFLRRHYYTEVLNVGRGNFLEGQRKPDGKLYGTDSTTYGWLILTRRLPPSRFTQQSDADIP